MKHSRVCASRDQKQSNRLTTGSVNVILVVGHEKLNVEMQRAYGNRIVVVKVPKSGGVSTLAQLSSCTQLNYATPGGGTRSFISRAHQKLPIAQLHVWPKGGTTAQLRHPREQRLVPKRAYHGPHAFTFFDYNPFW